MIKTTKKKDGTEKTVYVCDCCGKKGTNPHFTKTIKYPQKIKDPHDLFCRTTYFNLAKRFEEHLCKECWDKCWQSFTDTLCALKSEHWHKKFDKKSKLFP